jgi:hypothetical protein
MYFYVELTVRSANLSFLTFSSNVKFMNAANVDQTLSPLAFFLLVKESTCRSSRAISRSALTRVKF